MLTNYVNSIQCPAMAKPVRANYARPAFSPQPKTPDKPAHEVTMAKAKMTKSTGRETTKTPSKSGTKVSQARAKAQGAKVVKTGRSGKRG